MEKQVKPPLKEAFAGLVYDMFRAAGMPISQPNQEKVEGVAPRFAEAIKREAREAALTLAKRLQAATIEGFENFGKSLDRTHSEIEVLKKEVGELKDEVARLTRDNKQLRTSGKIYTGADTGAL